MDGAIAVEAGPVAAQAGLAAGAAAEEGALCYKCNREEPPDGARRGLMRCWGKELFEQVRDGLSGADRARVLGTTPAAKRLRDSMMKCGAAPESANGQRWFHPSCLGRDDGTLFVRRLTARNKQGVEVVVDQKHHLCDDCLQGACGISSLANQLSASEKSALERRREQKRGSGKRTRMGEYVRKPGGEGAKAEQPAAASAAPYGDLADQGEDGGAGPAKHARLASQGDVFGANGASVMSGDGERPKVYIAGPDVFLPPDEVSTMVARKREICSVAGLDAVFSLDQPVRTSGMKPDKAGCAIAQKDEATVRGCDAVLANMTPFRGASMDCGTSFIVGFARGLGIPVFGYTNDVRPYAVRAGALSDGLQVENHGLVDNCMVVNAAGGTRIATPAKALPTEEYFTHLDAFEAAVSTAARHFKAVAARANVGEVALAAQPAQPPAAPPAAAPPTTALALGAPGDDLLQGQPVTAIPEDLGGSAVDGGNVGIY